MVSLVILMAAILKIGHIGNFVYRSRVNRLIMTREMSLNKMVPLMEGPGGGGGGCTVTPPRLMDYMTFPQQQYCILIFTA